MTDDDAPLKARSVCGGAGRARTSKRMEFERKISLGNAITLLVLLVTLSLAWSEMVSDEEMRVHVERRAVVRIERLEDTMNQVRLNQREVLVKLETLIENQKAR
jgi:hypothetical protein